MTHFSSHFQTDNANIGITLRPVSLCCAELCTDSSLPSGVFLSQDLGIPLPPLHSGELLHNVVALYEHFNELF